MKIDYHIEADKARIKNYPDDLADVIKQPSWSFVELN